MKIKNFYQKNILNALIFALPLAAIIGLTLNEYLKLFEITYGVILSPLLFASFITIAIILEIRVNKKQERKLEEHMQTGVRPDFSYTLKWDSIKNLTTSGGLLLILIGINYHFSQIWMMAMSIYMVYTILYFVFFSKKPYQKYTSKIISLPIEECRVLQNGTTNVIGFVEIYQPGPERIASIEKCFSAQIPELKKRAEEKQEKRKKEADERRKKYSLYSNYYDIYFQTQNP